MSDNPNDNGLDEFGYDLEPPPPIFERIMEALEKTTSEERFHCVIGAAFRYAHFFDLDELEILAAIASKPWKARRGRPPERREKWSVYVACILDFGSSGATGSLGVYPRPKAMNYIVAYYKTTKKQTITRAKAGDLYDACIKIWRTPKANRLISDVEKI